MKYLFILGRNPKLSIAEIFAFLKRTENPIRDHKISQNGLLIEVSKELEKDTIN